MTKNDVVSQAVDQCLKELYSIALPKTDWEEFVKENEIYSDRYELWKKYSDAFYNRESDPESWEKIRKIYPDWENKSITECIGPRPFEFHYIPREILKDICDSYVYAYDLDHRQWFLDNIKTLKDYCKNPIVDKYVPKDGDTPGYRDYDHPDNLEKEITKILSQYGTIYDETLDSEIAKELVNKFFEFLDMAGNFYNWTTYLNAFNMSVYLGPSPNSNKEAVIENWKKYRKQDITIDEEKMIKEYFDEDGD